MPAKSLFFIAIIPPEPIKSDVTLLKEEVYAKYGSKSALKSPPHITLHMPFQWRKDREEQLKEKLLQFHFADYPFEIELKDFGFFDPRVVFVNVVANEKLRTLKSSFDGFAKTKLGLFNADYKDKGFHPHMTIGFRDLKKSLFPEIKAQYATRTFDGSFEVSDICLLRHTGKHWEEWAYF